MAFTDSTILNIDHIHYFQVDQTIFFLLKMSTKWSEIGLTLSLKGGGLGCPPPSGIGDCSKTHLYINLKVLDFSYISKTKILKKKKKPQNLIGRRVKFWGAKKS